MPLYSATYRKEAKTIFVVLFVYILYLLISREIKLKIPPKPMMNPGIRLKCNPVR